MRHKPGCTATEDGKKLEISNLCSRGITICSKNKGADQLHALWLFFAKGRFSHDTAQIIYVTFEMMSEVIFEMN